MALIALFFQPRTGESIAAEHLTAKMERQLNFQTFGPSAQKNITSKLVSLPCCLGSAASPASPDNDPYLKSNHCCSKKQTRFPSFHRRQESTKHVDQRLVSQQSQISHLLALNLVLTRLTTAIESITISTKTGPRH